MGSVSPGPVSKAPSAPGRRRGALVLGGLVLTFSGLAALLVVVPFQPPAFPSDLAALAVAVLGLWAGGILLGRAAVAGHPRK